MFFQTASSRSVIKFLKKAGFKIKEGSRHTKATNNKGVVIVIPRHKQLTPGVVDQIVKILVNQCGLPEDEVTVAFKK